MKFLGWHGLGDYWRHLAIRIYHVFDTTVFINHFLGYLKSTACLEVTLSKKNEASKTERFQTIM